MKKHLQDLSAFLLIAGGCGGFVTLGPTLLVWVIGGTEGVDWDIFGRAVSASAALIAVSFLAFLASERIP